MQRMRELRKKKRMSAKELAEKVGTCYITIYRYENGERMPDLDIAVKIAEALDCKVDELIDKKAG